MKTNRFTLLMNDGRKIAADIDALPKVGGLCLVTLDDGRQFVIAEEDHPDLLLTEDAGYEPTRVLVYLTREQLEQLGPPETKH